MLTVDPAENIQLLATNNMLPALISVADSGHFDRLMDWPVLLQGGPDHTCSLITQVVSVFYLPLANEIDSNLLDLLQQIMIKAEIVQKLLGSFKYLHQDFLELPMSLLYRLVLNEKGFSKQFVEMGGLDPKLANSLLRDTNPNGVIADMLLIISQLARSSKTYYENIHSASLYGSWLKLLAHQDANIRAKTCNLIGNLCKYSAYFYAELKK